MSRPAYDEQTILTHLPPEPTFHQPFNRINQS